MTLPFILSPSLRGGGGGAPEPLTLPYSVNFNDFELGDLVASDKVVLGSPNQPTPQIIAPYYDVGSKIPTNSKILKIAKPTSGLDSNYISVGFPFPGPLAIPETGQIRVCFSCSKGNTPIIGSGDNRQENVEHGIYREVGDDLPAWINNNAIGMRSGWSYYEECETDMRAVDTADYEIKLSTKPYQSDGWGQLRLTLDFDTGLATTQWVIQYSAFNKAWGQAPVGKLSAWVDADEGMTISGLYLRNKWLDSNSSGTMEVGHVWIGSGTDAFPNSATMAMADSIG